MPADFQPRILTQVIGVVDHPGREPQNPALEGREDFEAHGAHLPRFITAGIVALDGGLINPR